MFEEFERRHLPTHHHLDLSPNYHQLQTVLNLAVFNQSTQHPLRQSLEDIINFPTLHHNLFKLALDSPFGTVIHQIIDDIIMLTALQQLFLIKVQDELQQIKLENEEALDGARSTKEQDSGIEQQALPQTIIADKFNSSNLTMSKSATQYQQNLFHYQQRLLDLATHTIKAVDTLMINAKATIIDDATKKLGCQFNEEELAILNSAPSLEHVQQKINQSYERAGMLDRVGMTKDHLPAVFLRHAVRIENAHDVECLQ